MVQLTMKINGTEVPREQTKGLSPTLKDAINTFRELARVNRLNRFSEVEVTISYQFSEEDDKE